jgi:hypothetical protein
VIATGIGPGIAGQLDGANVVPGFATRVSQIRASLGRTIAALSLNGI